MAARMGDVEDDDLETMDRTSLLDVMTKNIVAKSGTEKEAIGGGVIVGGTSEKTDSATRELELQLELKKMDVENKRIEQESKRIEAEQENK